MQEIYRRAVGVVQVANTDMQLMIIGLSLYNLKKLVIEDQRMRMSFEGMNGYSILHLKILSFILP